MAKFELNTKIIHDDLGLWPETIVLRTLWLAGQLDALSVNAEVKQECSTQA